MSIPVRVSPVVRAHVAASGRAVDATHPLAAQDCPVCDLPLVGCSVSLVYVGRFPDMPSSWTAAAVAVHDGCTDSGGDPS